MIAGSIDGSNIMGVLPVGAANVLVYDPYDATGTTNWTDVGKGVAALANTVFKKDGAPTGVLNASLGEAGSTPELRLEHRPWPRARRTATTWSSQPATMG